MARGSEKSTGMDGHYKKFLLRGSVFLAMMLLTSQLTGLDTVSAFSVQTSVRGGDRYFLFEGVEVNFVKINKLLNTFWLYFPAVVFPCSFKKHILVKPHTLLLHCKEGCFKINT